jgi:hypothetical protein
MQSIKNPGNTRSILFLIVLLLFNYTVGASDRKGLVPVNTDGFETGDWRNFRPHYVGDAKDWIRPNFVINDSDPHSGDNTKILITMNANGR